MKWKIILPRCTYPHKRTVCLMKQGLPDLVFDEAGVLVVEDEGIVQRFKEVWLGTTYTIEAIVD